MSQSSVTYHVTKLHVNCRLSRNLNPDVAFGYIKLNSPFKLHIFQVCRAVKDFDLIGRYAVWQG